MHAAIADRTAATINPERQAIQLPGNRRTLLRRAGRLRRGSLKRFLKIIGDGHHPVRHVIDRRSEAGKRFADFDGTLDLASLRGGSVLKLFLVLAESFCRCQATMLNDSGVTRAESACDGGVSHVARVTGTGRRERSSRLRRRFGRESNSGFRRHRRCHSTW